MPDLYAEITKRANRGWSGERESWYMRADANWLMNEVVRLRAEVANAKNQPMEADQVSGPPYWHFEIHGV